METGESVAGGATSTSTTTGTSASQWRLRFECILLFVGVPSLLLLVRQEMQGLVVPLLLLGALGVTIYLLRDPSFEKRRLWNGQAFFHQLWRSLRVLLPLGAVACLFSWLYAPERFLSFPLRNPRFWLVVMLLYPILSAYPQELLYRVFFHQRYRVLFSSDRQWMVASALAFGWAHAFLGNWVAPTFTALGGLLFANTYLRSKSLLQTALEHGLWGDLLFTVGIGWYFYAGSIS